MVQCHRREMGAGRPTRQDDRSGNAIGRTIGGKPVERARDFGDDVGEGHPRRQRIAGNGNRPAMGGDAFDEHGEQFARIALPIAAMQEHQAWCLGPGGRVEIDLVVRPLTVRQIEMGFQRASQPARGFVPFGDQGRAVLDGRVVVIGSVAFCLGQSGPCGTGIERPTCRISILNHNLSDAALDGTLVQFGPTIHRQLRYWASRVQIGQGCLEPCDAGSLLLSLGRTTLLLRLHPAPIQAKDTRECHAKCWFWCEGTCVLSVR
ncbi:hypothetical protein IQ17_05745 [Bradyrhizobium daqingense]|uniref:Uncharacterized protein n=1 Tax=Bradyrhizobium daqingense TaxID=993502 RepID=A0A562KTI6_9BRAD|nr:hypothetical protein IQ17_05745 [Bradyrhizobium daqingense]